MDKKKKINQIKRNLKDNKVALLLLLALLLIGTGTTYALWQLTFSQTGTNVITTGCFKIEFEEQNDINLENAYPVTDEEGKSLTPFEFKLINTCDSEATYYINLETITTSEKKLNEGYLKASLKKGENEVFLNTLNSSYINLDKVISESSNAYKLYQGKLKGKEVTTFYLNLWLDENTEAVDEVMNAAYEGKVTVSTSYKAPNETENMMVAMETYSFYDNVDMDNIIMNNVYTQNQKYMVDEVIFESEMHPYNDALEVVDFSVAQDKTVLGYYVSTDDVLRLYIQADGKIKVNPNASYYGVVYTYERSFHYNGKVSFYGLENLDTSMVTNMSYMFYGNTQQTIDLSTFDTSQVTDMSYMFYGCSKLASLDVSGFNTSKVTNMDSMFHGCSNVISLSLNNFNTGQVTNMNSMFYNCRNLNSLDLSNFDTSKVTNMDSMFHGCSSLTVLDLSNFDTGSVTNMYGMFWYCISLTSIDLSNFDTSKVTDMDSMFSGCSGLTSLNLGDFNTSKVNNMYNMFASCKKLTTSITIMNSNITDYGSMFRNAATEEGSGITVNYTTETSDLVDQMIATKSSNSNVVKGTLIS